jgi:3-oxoadipate enol-lactonase
MTTTTTRTAPIAVHHQVDGRDDAPTVVLSNSLGSTLEMWEPQVLPLSRQFRVVRYDTRGHGRSPVPPAPYRIADLGADLVALLDQMGVARAHLVGLSLGGMACLWVAAHHPERVDRLVVCCSSARLGAETAWAERAAIVRARGTPAVADAVVARWFTNGFRARFPEVVRRMRDMIAATPAEGYAACCGAVEHMDLRGDLGSIRAPTLAIAGADDTAIPPEHLFVIARAVADGRAVVVEGGAHLANFEQPDRITELILRHLTNPQIPDPPFYAQEQP